MNKFQQYIKKNKIISSLSGALINALVLWSVFSISFWIAKYIDTHNDRTKIFLCQEAFMVYIAISGLLIVVFVAYCQYKKSPPCFTFHNDRFAYFTISARFSTNYKKAIPSGMWDPKEPIRDMEAVFEKILPDNIFDVGQQQKKSNNELMEKFVNEIKKYNQKESSEEFYAYAPFILVEHYFYFNILFNIANKEKNFRDPYLTEKENSINIMDDEIEKFKNYIFSVYKDDQNIEDKLKTCIKCCVNYNSTDLSQIKGHTSYLKHNKHMYVNNDLDEVADAIVSKRFDKVDIITDNYGLELISDIIFALVLLDSGLAEKTVFHARILPAFVSDVIVCKEQPDKDLYGDDFDRILKHLAKNDEKIVSSFSEYKDKGKIEIKPNLYWNMPFCYSETKSYFDEIIQNDNNRSLVVVKGDLNFRRLLDDRDWLYKRSFKNRVKGLNVSIVALRSIKSSLLVDVKDEKKVHAVRDSISGIDGKYASIHFYENNFWRDSLKKMI